MPGEQSQDFPTASGHSLFGIVNRLSTSMAKIVAIPDIRERFAALGIEPGCKHIRAVRKSHQK